MKLGIITLSKINQTQNGKLRMANGMGFSYVEFRSS